MHISYELVEAMIELSAAHGVLFTSAGADQFYLRLVDKSIPFEQWKYVAGPATLEVLCELLSSLEVEQ